MDIRMEATKTIIEGRGRFREGKVKRSSSSVNMKQQRGVKWQKERRQLTI